jgi:galactosylceramidase
MWRYYASALFFAPSAAQQYAVDLAATGLPFAGVGAQSTAGSARLLIDYPEPQRSQVLDFLFKPQFGASLQHLKVEIGGDAQISCGAEASGQRTANATPDWAVGYEGWLMAEAKKRNPDIPLLGLVYAWPSWVNPSGSSPFESPATEANAAAYMTGWVRGMRDTYNVSLDWVGRE